MKFFSLNIVKSNVDLESKYLSVLPVKVQIKFAKALLGVNKQAVNLAVLGELGMYPISIHAFKSAIEYWLHILKSEDILLYKAYETINRSLPDSFACITNFFVEPVEKIEQEVKCPHLNTYVLCYSKNHINFAYLHPGITGKNTKRYIKTIMYSNDK